MARQNGLTVIVPLKKGATEDVRRMLGIIHRRLEDSTLIPFADLKSVHFIRWVILPETKSEVTGREYPASLVFHSSFDGEVREHLLELVNEAKQGIDAIYRHCRGYPAEEHRTEDSRVDYLLAHEYWPGIFYEGHPGLTVVQIKKDDDLRKRIREHFEKEGAPAASPLELREKIREFVKGEEDLTWARDGGPPRLRLGFSAVKWTGIFLLSLVCALVMGPSLALLCIAVYRLEKGDSWEPVSPKDTGEADFEEVQGVEDYIAQNQYTHVVEVKEGSVRAKALSNVLSLVNMTGKLPFFRKTIINLSSLHFVSWVLIDGGQRVLFLSNYDGSAIKYVGDFVDRSKGIPKALTGIWSNTHGFPKSHCLIWKGAKDLPKFRDFLRDHQKHSQVWYSAYSTLTASEITSNQEFRLGLSGAMDEDEARKWLQKL